MGHSVELPCIASGYPNPTIRWLKDGRPLPADSRWTRRISGLTISDLRLEDSGNYICEVTNSFGSKEVTGHLNVIGKLNKRDSASLFTSCATAQLHFSSEIGRSHECEIRIQTVVIEAPLQGIVGFCSEVVLYVVLIDTQCSLYDDAVDKIVTT